MRDLLHGNRGETMMRILVVVSLLLIYSSIACAGFAAFDLSCHWSL